MTTIPFTEMLANTKAMLEKLPADKIPLVADFVGYLLAKEEDQVIMQGIASIVDNDPAFAFLHDPAEDIYTLADAEEIYEHAKG